MEISKLPENGIKIKSKVASLGIYPLHAKTAVDAALLLEKTLEDFAMEHDPLIIRGPGEYEVKGIKITGHSKDDAIVYTGRIDNIRIGIMKTSGLSKTKDLLEESDVVIAEADMIPDQKLIAALNAKVIVLYGQHAQEGAKALGKEVNPVTKYVTTKDKLPSEMEVIALA